MNRIDFLTLIFIIFNLNYEPFVNLLLKAFPRHKTFKINLLRTINSVRVNLPRINRGIRIIVGIYIYIILFISPSGIALVVLRLLSILETPSETKIDILKCQQQFDAR